MTAPFYSSNENVSVGGRTYSVDRWRHIARQAATALQADANDVEAQEALDYARYAIGSYAQTLSGRERPAAQRDTREATDPGGAASAALGFGQGASFGLADELSGALTAIPRMVPGGESPSAAYYRGRDENRAMTSAAQAFQAPEYVGGNILGGIAGSAAAVTGATRAVPAIGATLAAGGRLGASTAEKLRSMLMGGAVGGVIAGADAYGRGEEGPIQDVGGAVVPAVLGAAGGTLATGAAGMVARRSAANTAREVKLANEAEASALDVARQRAQVSADEARARVLGARALETEATAPLRIERAQQGVEAGRVRAAQVPAREGILTEQAKQAPMRTQLLEQRVGRANRMRQAQVGGPASQTEAGVRAQLERQGFSGETLERAVAQWRQTRMPGGATVTPPPTATPAQPVVPAPSGMPGSAVPGQFVPQSTMQGSPREAARAAHAQVTAAGGTPEAATEAARRAAGMAQEAMPAPTTIGLDDVQNVLGESAVPIQRIAMSEPNQESLAAMMRAIEPLSEPQRMFILRMLPVRWKEALGL